MREAKQAVAKVTSPFNRSLLLAFGATISSLVLVATISYRSYTRSRLGDSWIRHTQDVLHHLDDLLAATESAESQCRGFILTGQPFYLDAYRASVLRAAQEETTIRTLTSDNLEQQRKLLTLETLTAETINDQEMLIYLRQKHGLQTAAEVLEGEARRGMTVRFEALARGLEDEELQLLTRRREDARRGLQEDWIVLTFGTALGILVAAATSWKAWRGNLARGRADQASRNSEEKYRMILDGIQGYAIFMLDPQGRVVSWNAGAQHLKGYKASEIVGQHFSCFFPPEEIKQGKPEEVLERTAANGRHEERGMRVRKDGSQFLAQVTLTAMHDLSGNLRGYSEVSHDLTETEEAGAKYRGLLEAAPDALVIVGEKGEIVLLNSLAETQFGYERNKLLGQKVTAIIPRGFAEQLIADRTSAADAPAQQIGMGLELSGRRKDGSEFPIEIMLSPLDSPRGILVTAAIRDISVRKDAERQLAQTEARYRGLLEAAPDAMVVVNQGGEIVLLNVQAEKRFGYTRHELIGQKVTEIIPEGFAERIVTDALRSTEDARSQQIGTGIELAGRRKDGSEFPIEIMLSPLDSPEGILVTAAIRDISVRKDAERQLAQTEARYRGLLEAAPDAMVVVNQAGEIVLLNVQAEKRFGYTRHELIGRKVTEIIPDGFAERIVTDALRSTEDARLQQIGTGIELAGRRKDGSEFPIEIMLSPLDSPEGILVTAAVRDISERRIAEEALRESEARFRTMANNISQLAWMADEKGWVFWYNRRWFDYSGTTLDEMEGWAWQKLQHPDHAQRVSEKIKRCFQAGEAWEDAFPLRGRDGSYRWFLSQAIPVRDSEGNVSRWFGTNTDISEIRRMEEELFAEKERAQEAREEKVRLQVNAMERAREEKSHLQEAFLSHVSHELRTPLTAIYFFTTNLLDGLIGDLTAEQHEHLSRSLTNVSQLKDMVDDLLDITRIDTHKFTLEPRQASPLKLIADVLSTCINNAEGKHISLHSDVAGSLPFVWADVSRVRQILINLIDNGIKFTPEGGTVTVGSRPLEKSDDFLCLSVSDTGCGISPENLEIVFDRLAQLENANQANRNGLGLGLFIARELVSLHGGRIWVESPTGEGCTFYFTLPLFSLSKLCADIFTDANLSAGHVTLMAVDVSAIEGAVQAEIQPEIRRVLSRCIHPGQDILLPPMSDTIAVETYFIVACTNASGAAVIASRIGRELQNFDSGSKLKPVISSTTLAVARTASREVQTGEIATRIEELVQTHLGNKASLDQRGDLLIPATIG